MSSLIQYFVDKGSEHFSLTQILDFASNHPVLFSQNKFVEKSGRSCEIMTLQFISLNCYYVQHC